MLASWSVSCPTAPGQRETSHCGLRLAPWGAVQLGGCRVVGLVLNGPCTSFGTLVQGSGHRHPDADLLVFHAALNDGGVPLGFDPCAHCALGNTLGGGQP